ncbi:MAG: type III-A CRISPR-associated protein Csm2 [Chlorobi bacterium]|nr:type III-A CRISPR-associated protein Csm2 [Chlorobiota bacterium]
MKKNHQQNKSQENKYFDEKVTNYLNTVSVLLDIENEKAENIKNAINELDKVVGLMKRDGNNAVKTHQVRTIYTLLRNADNMKELYAIIPKLKYIGSRQKGKSGKFIAELIVELIDRINQDKQIKGLIYIMESIVAFHKFHFGDN